MKLDRWATGRPPSHSLTHSPLCLLSACPPPAFPPNFPISPSQVFKKRNFFVLYTAWAFIAIGLLTAPNLAFLLGAMVFTNLYVEFYGAVLHVVLDNPNFLTLPLIGEACLEFQVRQLNSIVSYSGDLGCLCVARTTAGRQAGSLAARCVSPRASVCGNGNLRLTMCI